MAKTCDSMLSKNPIARSLDPGQESILLPYTQDLLRFIFENCEEGVEVTVHLVAINYWTHLP